MDYDVIVIGSGFGGAVTACRLAESGLDVLVLERGRRWQSPRVPPRDGADTSTPFPRGSLDPWIWDNARPEHHNGWIDLRFFPNMAVVQGAGVGGGSLIYANVSVEAPPHVFGQASGWPPDITYEELRPYYQRVAKMLKVRPLPQNQWNPRTQLMKEAADKLGYGNRFRLVELAVRFSDDHEIDPTQTIDRDTIPLAPNEYDVPQGTCIHCGECDIGCEVNARNTLDTNYLPLAEKKGAEIRQLHLVTGIEPIVGGYRVYYERLREGQRFAGSQTTERVILAAGSLGSTELLLRCRDERRTLPNLSSWLGRNWSSNGDFLTPAVYGERFVSPGCGPTITSAIDFHDRSQNGHAFWIQDGGFPDFLTQHLGKANVEAMKEFQAGFLLTSINLLLQKLNPAGHVMPWFAQAVDAADGTLGLRRCCWLFGKRRLHLKWNIRRSKSVMNTVAEMHKQLAESTGGLPLTPLGWTLSRDLITPHPLGGCGMGMDSSSGVVNHAGEVFGHKNLFVADGSVFPRAIGVNPSRTIAALAERTAALIVQGESS